MLLSDVSDVAVERETLQLMDWNAGTSTWDHYSTGSWSSNHRRGAGNFTTTNTMSFSNHIFTIGSINENNLLPIELVEYTARLDDGKVYLNWKTVQEINNDFFTIEKSKDGKNFESIAEVKGLGNSAVGKEYEFIDHSPLQGISYYRLKQTDFDGTTTYFDVNSINNLSFGEPIDLVVYPNPTKTSNINIRLEGTASQEKALLQINDMYGRQNLLKEIYSNDTGVIWEHIETIRLKAGIYILTVYVNNTYYSKKLIITN